MYFAEHAAINSTEIQRMIGQLLVPAKHSTCRSWTKIAISFVFLENQGHKVDTESKPAVVIEDTESVFEEETVFRKETVIEMFKLTVKSSSSHDQLLEMTNFLAGPCQHYRKLNQHSRITSLVITCSRSRTE